MAIWFYVLYIQFGKMIPLFRLQRELEYRIAFLEEDYRIAFNRFDLERVLQGRCKRLGVYQELLRGKKVIEY